VGGLLDWLGGVADWLSAAWEWLKNELGELANWAWAALQKLGSWIAAFPGAILKALKWLSNLKLSDVWQWLKTGFGYLQKLIGYYKKYILGPMEQERQQLQALYNTYLRPIVGIIDGFRKLTNIIAIFNKKLAAKIDQRLMALEAWILAPFLHVLERVNQLSSWARAIVTELGYFDRETELESMRRDVVLIWQVLTNPLQRNLTQAGTGSQPGTGQVVQNLTDFLDSGTGPYVDSTAWFCQAYQQAQTDIGD
jgi:hypothetical protein